MVFQNDITADSWLHLQELLFQDDQFWNLDLRRFRSPFVYRGMPDSDSHLITSLMRLGGNYANLEWQLLRNFKKYAHHSVVERDTDWHWLAVAQHHGLPTRLMDWTYSPYVALHFVTANMARYDRDGVLWLVNFERCKEFLPRQFRHALERENANGFTAEMLMKLNVLPQDLDSHGGEEFVLFFEPPSIDERMINQFALFSLMSRVDSRMDQWLEKHPEIWKRLIIPASLKWEVRDKLDQANITERVLFPGLDGLSRWLTRYYSPGPQQPSELNQT